MLQSYLIYQIFFTLNKLFFIIATIVFINRFCNFKQETAPVRKQKRFHY